MKRSPLTRRTPLRSRSARTAARDRKRAEFRVDVLSRRWRCEIGPVLTAALAEGRESPLEASVLDRAARMCTGRATELHEPLKRSRGGSVLDEENCWATCHNCHLLTEQEVDLCTRLGLLVPSWQRRR